MKRPSGHRRRVKERLERRVLCDAIGWDVGNWSRAIEFWEDRLERDLAGAKALELGCGRNGGLSLWLALRGCDVVCSGCPRIEPQPVAIHRRYGVENRVSYAVVDARQIPFVNAFDIICFKSMLGGIARNDRPQEARRVIASVERALKPGGYLLFAENLLGTRWHRWLRRRYASGREGWRYWSVEELETMHEPFARFEFATFGCLGALGRREWQRNLLARIDSVLVPLLQPRSRYALAAVARRHSSVSRSDPTCSHEQGIE